MGQWYGFALPTQRLELTFQPCRSAPKHHLHLHDYVVGRHRCERRRRARAVHASLMLACAAITLLLSFHVYLTLSAQTTIEFYGNRVKSFRARRRGEVWSNPYDQGMRRNWEQVSKPAQHSLCIAEGAFAVAQVFGTMHPLLSILPARRKPGAHPSCLIYICHMARGELKPHSPSYCSVATVPRGTELARPAPGGGGARAGCAGIMNFI